MDFPWLVSLCACRPHSKVLALYEIVLVLPTRRDERKELYAEIDRKKIVSGMTRFNFNPVLLL